MSEIKNDIENLGTGILVINKENQALLGKRLGTSYLSGSYGVPGGRVRMGESLIASAKRELLEETGLEAKSLDFVGIVNDNRRQRTFIHTVFVCKEFAGTPQNLEPEKCEEWKWFGLDLLPENILPGHKAGIEMYQNEIRLIELF